MRGFVLAATLGSLLAISGLARADDSDRARTLFFDARALMRSDRYEEACPMLEESQRLDPGMGTEFNLADCHEHIGRLASALSHFEHVVETSHGAGQERHETLARQRVDALATRVPTLVVEIPTKVAGLEVMRDGAVLDAHALRLDPGDHVLAASAPGRKPWTESVHLAEGDHATVRVPDLEAIPLPPVVQPPPPPPPVREGGTQRTLGLALGGAGAAALVAGGVFGALSLAAHDDAQRWCNDTTNGCTSQRGVDARETAFARGNVATVLFVAGGVLLAAGATTWLTAPRARRALRGEF